MGKAGVGLGVWKCVWCVRAAKRRPGWLGHLSWGRTRLHVKDELRAVRRGEGKAAMYVITRFQARDGGDGDLYKVRQWREGR